MKNSDLAELLGLAALWGASFVFVRTGAAGFGPVALAALRVIGAALLLMPLLALRGDLGVLRRHWRALFVVGITNSALPFLLFAYAALSITAGLSAIFNAASPPSGQAWLTTNLLAVFCTGVAYLLYFRLIAHIGPANAIAVTFLIPAFAALWGWLFLDERIGVSMVAGCVVILLGTGMATGLLLATRAARSRPPGQA